MAADRAALRRQRGAQVGLRAELAVFRRPAVLLALAMVVFGCGGLFTFSTYIAPMTTEVTGWRPPPSR